MAMIGNTATQQAFTPAIDYFSGNGSTVAFTLSRPVASVAQIQAVIENVPQNPSTAFTVSGNTITFTSAPPSGSNNIYVYYTSPITQVAALPQSPQVFGNLQFSSAGARITGDFSNATVANRVMFQSSTVNGVTAVGVLPNGTATSSFLAVYPSNDPSNTGYGYLAASPSDVTIRSVISGTGTYLPMTFFTGGSERMRVDTSGNVGIGTSSPATPLHIANAIPNIRLEDTDTNAYSQVTSDNAGVLRLRSDVGNSQASSGITFEVDGTERMRIDSNGIVTGTAGNLMLVSGTAVSASGTSVTFTGIPSWVKRITVMCSGISTNGTSDLLLRLGYSGGVETSGYLGAAATIPIGSANVTNYTAGFGFSHSTGNTAARIWYYTFVLTNVSGNTWMCAGTGGISDAAACYTSAGNKTTSGTLDRISITTAGGTNTFDAGSINILYE